MRRDEADAQARDEEEDLRTQIIDAEKRLQLLRGNRIETLPPDDGSPRALSRSGDDHGHSRKRRRVAGEDDTDRDIRLARETATLQHPKSSDALQATNTLTDSQGHIDLFPSRVQQNGGNVEAEAERAKKKRDYEDQFTMRFSNAAGFKQGLNAPWYATGCKGHAEIPRKDVSGDDDIRKKAREKARAANDDPLAVIKKGVKQLHDVENRRQDWRAGRERELRELEGLQHSSRFKRTHRKRRREKTDSDILENFSLDSSAKVHKNGDRHHIPRRHEHEGGNQEYN